MKAGAVRERLQHGRAKKAKAVGQWREIGMQETEEAQRKRWRRER